MTAVDMVEHMEVLSAYASRCERVVEFGVRDGDGSTKAFLAGKPKELISYDIRPCPAFLDDQAASAGVKFTFRQKDVLEAEDVPKCDLLFIDTVHTYGQLKEELRLHGNKAKRWLVFHDTEIFGERGAAEWGVFEEVGLNHAIREFQGQYPEWKTKEVFMNCCGLTILERDNDMDLPDLPTA